MSKSKTKKVKLKTTPHEELLKELEYLRAENAYLKKLQDLSRGAHCPRERERAQAIEGLRPEQCRLLTLLLKAAGMARSTFYYHFRSNQNNPINTCSRKREYYKVYITNIRGVMVIGALPLK